MTKDHTEMYDQCATDNGWTTTRTFIHGHHASVYQRGREIAVREHGRDSGLYEGRSVEHVANYLRSKPVVSTLTSHIETDLEGLIAYLATQQAERIVLSKGAQTLREKHRLGSEATGISMSIRALQSWKPLKENSNA